jgi:hypothetical protein
MREPGQDLLDAIPEWLLWLLAIVLTAAVLILGWFA